jgi:hypothetical protein
LIIDILGDGKMTTKEWLFRMDWCLDNGYSPSQNYYWNLAGAFYKKHLIREQDLRDQK